MRIVSLIYNADKQGNKDKDVKISPNMNQKEC